MSEKLNIRLPSDHGPNPYDSATPFQKPRWATFSWWFAVIAMGCLFGIMGFFKTNT